MPHLTRNDYATALALLAALERAGGESALLEAMLRALPGFVACGQARLVQIHFEPAGEAAPAVDRAPGTLRLVLDDRGPGLLCVELRRTRTEFTLRDRERVALLQPHLAYLYRQAARRTPAWPDAGLTAPIRLAQPPAGAGRCGLTSREAEVMRWLSCGKTDADIAALLVISRRTVHKHLEHIYVKLGVETRTAAVMAVHRQAAAGPPLTGS